MRGQAWPPPLASLATRKYKKTRGGQTLLKKFLKILVGILSLAMFAYMAATLVFGFWARPARPLPAECADAGGLPVSTQMPVPDLPDLNGTQQNGCPLISIAVLSNGAHTDFLLPALVQFLDADGRTPLVWPDVFPLLLGLKPTADLYVYIGWGQREFYLNTPTWTDIQLSLLLRAAMGAPAAMHVEYTQAPDLAGLEPDYAILRLTPEEYAALARFIISGLPRGPDGQTLRIPAPGFDVDDAFYEAGGHFSLLNTCNTWAADALHAAGQAAPRWTNLAWFVLYHLRNQDR